MKRKILSFTILTLLVTIPLGYTARKNNNNQITTPNIVAVPDPVVPLAQTSNIPPASPDAQPSQTNTTIASDKTISPVTQNQPVENSPAATDPTPQAQPQAPEPATNISCHSTQEDTGSIPKYANYWDCLKSDGSTSHTFMGYTDSPNFTYQP